MTKRPIVGWSCGMACLLIALLAVSPAWAADVKELIAQLGSGDDDAARSAARALGEMKGDGSEALGPLFDALDTGSPRVRLESLKALKEIGGADREALVETLLGRPKVATRLREMAEDRGPLVQRAVEGLTQESSGALRGRLEDATADGEGRARAAEMIGELADDRPETVAALEKATEDPDESVRAAAEGALDKVRARKGEG